MKKLIFGICAASLSTIFPASLFAEQCSNYKFSQLGAKIIETDEGPKIVSTGKAAVLLDDIEVVSDAFEEAKLKAKTEIVKFYNDETLQNECNNGQSILSNRVLTNNPDGKSANFNQTRAKEIICNTRTSTSGVLKGVVTVEQCYQKGEYVQLTLGISPKTLKQAAGLKDNINYGVETPSSSNNVNRSNGLVPTEGFYYVDEDF